MNSTARACIALALIAAAVGCRNASAPPRQGQTGAQPATDSAAETPATQPILPEDRPPTRQIQIPVAPPQESPSVQAARDRLPEQARQATDLLVRTARSRPAESQPAAPASRPAAAPSDRFSKYLVAADKAMANGDFATAISLCRRALDEGADQASRCSDVYQCLAVALVAGEEFEQAVQVYQRLIELSGEDRTTLFNLALAQTRLGRYSQAEDTYRRLLARHGDFLQARYNLASLLQAQGKLALARDTWQRVIVDQPNLESARAALAEVLVDLNDPQGAMEQYAQAARLKPDLVSNWVNLAHCARSAGSLGRAAVAVKRAVELSPLDARIHRLRGQIFLEMHRLRGQAGLLNEALSAWQESLRLDTSQDDLRQMIRSYAAATRPAESR